MYRSNFDVVHDFLHDEAFVGDDMVLSRLWLPNVLTRRVITLVRTKFDRASRADWACKRIGVTGFTNKRWRREYGGKKTNHAKRLKELGCESTRLKQPSADAPLDKAIPREAANPNF